MWADSLRLAEEIYLSQLLLWGMGSIIAGTILLGVLILRGSRIPLLRHFAIQTAIWGMAETLLAALAWQRLALRDHGDATRLTNTLWLSTGLDFGYIAVGVTLIGCGWMTGRRAGLMGAGTAIVVQGIALATVRLHFLALLSAYS